MMLDFDEFCDLTFMVIAVLCIVAFWAALLGGIVIGLMAVLS